MCKYFNCSQLQETCWLILNWDIWLNLYAFSLAVVFRAAMVQSKTRSCLQGTPMSNQSTVLYNEERMTCNRRKAWVLAYPRHYYYVIQVIVRCHVDHWKLLSECILFPTYAAQQRILSSFGLLLIWSFQFSEREEVGFYIILWINFSERDKLIINIFWPKTKRYSLFGSHFFNQCVVYIIVP